MSETGQANVVPSEKSKGEERTLPSWVKQIADIFEEPDPPLSAKDQMRWRRLATRQLEQWSAIETEKLDQWQRAWLQWLVMVYEMLGEHGIDLSSGDFGDESPSWVRELERRLGKIWCPGVVFEAIGRSPEVQIGSVVGQEFCYWSRVRDQAMPGMDVLKGEGRTLLASLLETLKESRLSRVRRSIDIAMGEPLKESKAFFRGFGEGLRKDAMMPGEVLLGDQRLSLTYHLLLIHWPYVEELGSITECYCWLRSQMGKLAGPKLADLGLRGRDREQNPGYERLRKIFQRLGKSFVEVERPLVTAEK